MLTVQQLSKEVGVSSDTLRIWERRYGFPQPQRDKRGHRLYPDDQVEELRIVQKLKTLGKRPQTIFSLSPPERRHLLVTLQEPQGDEQTYLFSLACTGSPFSIVKYLDHWAKKGCADFIFSGLLPLLEVLDLAWISGKLSISREHLITDLVVGHLRNFIVDPLPADKKQPHCVFSTVNGERHKLGLLMAACLFSRQGIQCTILYEDIPVTEVPYVCSELKCDAVALSFSRNYTKNKAVVDLGQLRRLLPRPIEIIVGGEAVRDIPVLPGILLCPDLNEIGTIAELLTKKTTLTTA